MSHLGRPESVDSSFSLSPTSIFELVYKPHKSKGSSRSRGRNRGRDESESKKEKEPDKKLPDKKPTIKLNIKHNIIPASDDNIETTIITNNEEMHLQEFWVKNKGKPLIKDIIYKGIQKAKPSREVVRSI